MKLILLKLIDFYQAYLSFDQGILAMFAPGGACKYNPSCSKYSKQMINQFGVLKGSWYSLKRIWRCK